MSKDTTAEIALSCPQSPVEICDALSEALQSRYPAQRLVRSQQAHGSTLSIRLEILKQHQDFIIGRLHWQRPGGAETAGPEIETGTMDAQMGPDEIQQFARTLAQHSNLPAL